MTVFATDNQSKTMANTSKLIRLGLGGLGLTAASSQQTRAIPAALRSLIMAIFLVLAFPPMLHGAFVNGIDVISQNYQIASQWTEGFVNPNSPPGAAGIPPASGGYNVSSSDGTPVAASTITPDGVSGANASINEFSVHNSRYTLPGGAERVINGSYYLVWAEVPASAKASWDFRPAGPVVNLSLEINANQISYVDPSFRGITVELTDVTTSATLLDISLLGILIDNLTDGLPIAQNDTFSVNPSDVYGLSIDSEIVAETEDSSGEDITASISAPDGGLTLGMLGMAVGGLAFIRRKFQS